MATRTTWPKRGINYAKLNARGREGSETDSEVLEEGQLQDSPLQVHPSDDEFNNEPRSTEASSIATGFKDGGMVDGMELDYSDVPEEEDAALVVCTGVTHGTHSRTTQAEGENLGSDEVWKLNEERMVANHEKIEQLRKRLERQK